MKRVALAAGTRIRTEFGHEVQVIEKLGQGGQGAVYRVAYGSQEKALKWYWPDVFPFPERFLNNLRHNVLEGAPTSQFVWPLDLTLTYEGSYGYVMDLVPTGYYEAKRLLLRQNLFETKRRLVDACMNMVAAFRILHDKGYRYQDINGGNFFIDPKTGKLLIADNDNVAPEGRSTGMQGFLTYMAPEIITGEEIPSVGSDLHSMAVLIFQMLVLQHPLQGQRIEAYDEVSLRRMYGTDPLFAFDPNDGSNAPRSGSPSYRYWFELPQNMRDLFCRAFSQEALHDKRRRPNEATWMRELARYRSEIVACTCGSEMVLENAAPTKCDICGNPVGSSLKLVLGGYDLPLANDVRLYACQVRRACRSDEQLDPVLWVNAWRQDPRYLALRNNSKETWSVKIGEEVKSVMPDQFIMPRAGMELQLGKRANPVRVEQNENR